MEDNVGGAEGARYTRREWRESRMGGGVDGEGMESIILLGIRAKANMRATRGGEAWVPWMWRRKWKEEKG